MDCNGVTDPVLFSAVTASVVVFAVTAVPGPRVYNRHLHSVFDPPHPRPSKRPIAFRSFAPHELNGVWTITRTATL